MKDKDGSYLPTRNKAIGTGIFSTIIGVGWMVLTSSIPKDAGMFGTIFPLFGLVFIVLGIYAAIEGTQKADAYAIAERKYSQKRRRLLKKLDHLKQQ